jgi:2-dehydro-3-deoxy-D-arabinonate dehydratase
MHPILTRHASASGLRWAIDGFLLPAEFSLAAWLVAPSPAEALRATATTARADGVLLPPIEPHHEVWASGVTYLSSRMAREAESQSRDVYQKVYAAVRPELFYKSAGWRVRGHGETIRVRADSAWNVPEPELTLVLAADGAVVGYCVGNDVSSRSIEGENPLYLPQAKIYDGSCALGPGIRLCAATAMRDLPIVLAIERAGVRVFSGETRTAQIKRDFAELAAFLVRELSFPQGVFLLTGTGIVPGEDFTLQGDDLVRISIDGLVLENHVE